MREHIEAGVPLEKFTHSYSAAHCAFVVQLAPPVPEPAVAHVRVAPST